MCERSSQNGPWRFECSFFTSKNVIYVVHVLVRRSKTRSKSNKSNLWFDDTGLRWVSNPDLSLLGNRRYHWAITILECQTNFLYLYSKKIFFPKLEKSEKFLEIQKNCSSWLKISGNRKICKNLKFSFSEFRKSRFDNFSKSIRSI